MHSIPSKKCGQPLLLDDDLDEQVKCYVRNVKRKGVVTDNTVLIASAEE